MAMKNPPHMSSFVWLEMSQLVERHYPAFLQELTNRGRSVPAYVEEEFEAYLKCGRDL